MDRPGVHQVPEGSGEQRKMEEPGCKIICGVPTTLTVKDETDAIHAHLGFEVGLNKAPIPQYINHLPHATQSCGREV